MSNELVKFAEWTFMRECDIPKDVLEKLVPGEVAECAFQTIRDVAIFTSKRLIVRDAQGITGKKVETYSLPWSAVNMWSVENAGTIDLNAEVELWTRAGHVKINLKRGAPIEKIDALLAAHILN